MLNIKQKILIVIMTLIIATLITIMIVIIINYNNLKNEIKTIHDLQKEINNITLFDIKQIIKDLANRTSDKEIDKLIKELLPLYPQNIINNLKIK